jgi:hypothetical protein
VTTSLATLTRVLEVGGHVLLLDVVVNGEVLCRVGLEP